MATSREQAKQKRRAELLNAAARIMADRGFHQTRLGDVGAAVGISGPGVLRHFKNKDDLLEKILVDISIRLVDEARDAIASHAESGDGSPQTLMSELVLRHAEFAATEPDIIRVQEREIRNLTEDARRKVRSLQLSYLGLWMDVLLECRPDLDRQTARLRVQLAAGLINSTRHVIHWAGPDLLREQAHKMALAALMAE
ncbi:TetR/AcrR family transcriptional regulator [Corynebacterium epidermidicanis]|uniref:Transcriptional regulator, TetR family n=1 Tax=Corynebacterium epidermidicanis TaxID=1050174 RepID=A0A0G3GT05_9CORY|nr:TetR/AcrR family transcriptional regulator [Corynebacterium epidermidicanis]AKK02653.1 transcriptional regulator, TetR family [Corynebacterium epidermidicanis]